MRKVIENIAKVFEKYDCYSLFDLEKVSDSFGNGDGDKYYYNDLTFTKHSLNGNFCCFLHLCLKPVDLDKAIFKIEINEKRTFYTLSFRKEEILLPVEEMNKCKKMIEKIQSIVDNTAEICSGFYRFYGSKYLCREEVIDKIKSLKPFDILLVAKAKEEYELELEQKQNKVIEEYTGKNAEGLPDEERKELIEELFRLHPMLKYGLLFHN